VDLGHGDSGKPGGSCRSSLEKANYNPIADADFGDGLIAKLMKSLSAS
jgi:hypothetical protein